MSYKNIIIRKETYDLFKHVETIFRKHHPEMRGMPLSKNKLLYETIRWYIATEPEYKDMFTYLDKLYGF